LALKSWHFTRYSSDIFRCWWEIDCCLCQLSSGF